MSRTWTRRELLKLAPAAALAGGAAALGTASLLPEAERRVRTTCRLCTMHCGVVGHVRDGRLVEMSGDLESDTRGFICINGRALPELVHSTMRLAQPLLRSQDGLVPASWDEAYAGIADRLAEVRRRHGARALAVVTGWPFVRHPLIGLLQRFVHAYGSPNLATVASLCEASARLGRALVCGSNLVPDLEKARTLLLWGANPTKASPPFAHVVSSFAEGKRNLIVVDPVRHELAAVATIHLQPKPGTDLELALGMLHIIVRDRLYDQPTVRDHTVGFLELEEYVRGYPPGRVAASTGVEQTQLEAAARLFATQGPSCSWEGLGVEHQADGVQTVRAITMLAGICGFLGTPGGNTLQHPVAADFWSGPLPQLYRLTTPEPVPPPCADRPIGYEEFPLQEIYNRQAQGMRLTRAILDDDPYPVRALVVLGANPLVTWPGAARTRAAFEKLELLVTIDPFLTATGEASTVVLPATTFLEPEVLPPQHEARPDWRILFELAGAIGIGDYFPWQSLEEALAAPTVPYLQDADRTLRASPPHEGAPLPRFPTASGKLELLSAVLTRFGYDALPTVTARPPVTSTEYPLVLVSGPRSRQYINSQLRHVRSLARQYKEPEAELHAETAAEAGVQDGQRIRLTSPHGSVELLARVSDRLRPGVVVAPHGWENANVNALIDPQPLDPLSGFPVFRRSCCRIEAVSARQSPE